MIDDVKTMNKWQNKNEFIEKLYVKIQMLKEEYNYYVKIQI